MLPPLHQAIKDGNYEEVERLLNAVPPIDINARYDVEADTRGETQRYPDAPLYYALDKGRRLNADPVYQKIAALLIKKDAIVPTMIPFGVYSTAPWGSIYYKGGQESGSLDRPVLAFAMFMGWDEVVDALFDRFREGAPMYNRLDEWSRKPMIYAAGTGRSDWMIKLLDKGATVNKEDMLSIVEQGSADSVEGVNEILKRNPDLLTPADKQDLLYAAAKRGYVWMVKAFIDEGANPDLKKKGGSKVLVEVGQLIYSNQVPHRLPRLESTFSFLFHQNLNNSEKDALMKPGFITNRHKAYAKAALVDIKVDEAVKCPQLHFIVSALGFQRVCDELNVKPGSEEGLKLYAASVASKMEYDVRNNPALRENSTATAIRAGLETNNVYDVINALETVPPAPQNSRFWSKSPTNMIVSAPAAVQTFVDGHNRNYTSPKSSIN